MKKMNGNFAVSDPGLPAGHQGFRIFFELTKIHLSLYIALSAVFGHVLSQNRFSMDSLGLGGFVLVLTAGSAIFNHIQDRRYDRRFARTRKRCLVQKKITPLVPGVMATGFVLFGLGGLWACFPGIGNPLFGLPWYGFPWYGPAGLGLLALFCYNGLYTPLKKRTLVAIVPGTLCGMLPPAMGWVAVPREMAVADVTGILIVMVIFGLWQIPHFFIILLKQCPEELGASPYPCFTRIFSRKEIKGQVLIWTSLYSLGILLFLLRGWVHSSVLSMTLAAVGVILPFLMAGILRGKQHANSLATCFFVINLSILFFMGIGILDRI